MGKKLNKISLILSISLIILNVFILTIIIISACKPEAFGAWLVSGYEDLTNDYGHTVQGMYKKLFLIASIAEILVLVISLIDVRSISLQS